MHFTSIPGMAITRKPAQVGETLINILEAFPSYRDCGVFFNN